MVAEREPSLQFAVQSLSRVFDVHQSVGGLEVSYGGQDLRAAKKTLWSISITVSNPGSAGIRLTDFDERVPVSLSVSNGSIVDKPVVSGTTDYLLQTFRFRQEQTSLIFAPFILDPKDGVRISFLVLGQEGSQPALAVSGKIAGIRSISLVLPESVDATPSLWSRIVGVDAWWIQVPRGFVYFFGFIFSFAALAVALVALTMPFQVIADKRARRERKAGLRAFSYRPAPGHEQAYEKLLRLYEAEGSDAIVALLRLRRTLKTRQELIARLLDSGLHQEESLLVARRRYPSFPGDRSTFHEMKKASLIESGATGPELSEGLNNTLEALSHFLNVDMTRANLVLEEYWQQDDVRMIPTELLERAEADA